MTREEKEQTGKYVLQMARLLEDGCYQQEMLLKAVSIIDEALEQEPRKDEVILTNKEYRELIANEYDNGYCKGYAEALEEQEPILDKIRAEIAEYGSIMVAYAITKDTKTDKGIERLVSDVLKEAKEQVLEIIDKYKGGSEGT